MNDVTKFLKQAAGLLGALVAGGFIKSNSGMVITTLLNDISAVINGAQSPSPNLIGEVVALLNDLKVSNVITGQFVDELVTASTKAEQFIKAITTTPVAQPGIGPREKIAGVQGGWVFIPDNAAPEVKAPFGL